MKILLITGDADLRKRVKGAIVSRKDVEIDYALSAGEGINRIKMGKPHVLILDNHSVHIDPQIFFNHLMDSKINIPSLCVEVEYKITYPLFKGSLKRDFTTNEFELNVLKKEYKKGKILLAEDDRDFVSVVSNLLDDIYEFTAAYDGTTALRMMKSFSPDLVILDINLPDINGFQLCRTMREDSRYTGKILLLTVRGADSDLRLGAGAGADEYIQKPISNDIFLRTIEKLLTTE